MALGILYERFLAQQEADRQYAAAAAAAVQGSPVRQWCEPNPGTTWDGDPLNAAGIATAYDRTDIASAYASFFFSEYGTAGDCIAAKTQSDYLACQERAYRARHLTPVRAAAHAAARLRGHGNAEAGVFARLASHLQDVLIAGSTGIPSGGYTR